MLIARWITSLGRLSALALLTARRRRGFSAGSGMPFLAATVMSRDSLENSLERCASARPLRCMMFLNFEWPAMGSSSCVLEPERAVIKPDPQKWKRCALQRDGESGFKVHSNSVILSRWVTGVEPRPFARIDPPQTDGAQP
ncbi:hypothetical protein BREVUG8_40229 [Brevundimonas sp. G8]|nr:hypothetical protein BREVUG8_40229 [Brevundimonas sp. G8]